MVLEIAKSIPEYAGKSDVDEFIERLKIFNELTQPCDFKTKTQCLATRLRGSAWQYFDSFRDMETAYDCMDKLVEAFKARFIETSSTEKLKQK